MNVRRFTARTARDALSMVRIALGGDAVVLSTKPHGAALDPGVADTLTRHAAESAKRQEDLGHPACLLVPDLIRAPMARLLKRAAPRLRVLGHSEIPETHSIRIGAVIGSNA